VWTLAERHLMARVGPVELELVRARGSGQIAVLAAPGNSMTVVPIGMSTPATVAALRANRKSLLIGLFHPQHLLDEIGDAVAVAAQRVLKFGPQREQLQ